MVLFVKWSFKADVGSQMLIGMQSVQKKVVRKRTSAAACKDSSQRVTNVLGLNLILQFSSDLL
jgi:hypothetical protein